MAPMPTSPTGNSIRGFTLIEVLLVAVLVSIIAMMATPRFRATFDQLRFDQRAQDLAQLIRLGHELAILKSAHLRIAINEEARGAQLEEEFMDEEGRAGFRPMGGRMGRPWSLNDPARIDSSVEAIDCFPDGRTTPATIRLIHRQGEHLISLGAFGGSLLFE